MPRGGEHLPRMIVTGASGFLGRRLLETFAERYRIVAIARRTQIEAGALMHPNISWHQIDISFRRAMGDLFGEIADDGPVRMLVHLAAHYDFSGEEHPEYWRTNVDGLRNVLDLSRPLGLERFVFASSIAACDYPPPGELLDESSPPDGEHIYARTKAIGERMLAEYSSWFPSTIVRFAAMFSDWCEYPPLYAFLGTWLSDGWNSRVLGGRGHSAVPFLHVRDASIFVERAVERSPELPDGQVLCCSTHGATTHEELFEAATAYRFGSAREPMHVPKPLAGPGMWVRDLAGRLTGDRPFERPWMAGHIDKALAVDPTLSWQLLDWEPRERLEVLRRLPFLIENARTDPIEWQRRNEWRGRVPRLRGNLRVHLLLERHEEEIRRRYHHHLRERSHDRLTSYRRVPAEEHEWHHRLILRNVMNAVRTREKGIFMAYCRDLATRRFSQGFPEEQLVSAISDLGPIATDILRDDPDAADLDEAIHNHVTMTIRFGVDQVHETYEELRAGRSGHASDPRIEDQMWRSRGSDDQRRPHG